MLTRCPYPDCMFAYQAKVDATGQSFFAQIDCPQCKRKGRAKSLEIINSLQDRANKKNCQPDTDIFLNEENQFQVLLEDIRSLWNVGSIFRTADAVGVSMLYLCGITGCPPRSEIAKTALGAEEFIPWQYRVNPLDIIVPLKGKGVSIIGLERNGQSISLTAALKEGKISKPLCLVIGNENTGLSPETLHYCNYICNLPMRGTKESLNAAVAFGVAAYFINELN